MCEQCEAMLVDLTGLVNSMKDKVLACEAASKASLLGPVKFQAKAEAKALKESISGIKYFIKKYRKKA